MAGSNAFYPLSFFSGKKDTFFLQAFADAFSRNRNLLCFFPKLFQTFLLGTD